MKHCPECGAELLTPSSAFCPECGARLSVKKAPAGKHPKPVPKHFKKHPEKKKKKAPAASRHRQDDLPYDGYYDDVLPIDDGEYRQGLDPKTIKKIGMFLAGVLLIVAICVVALYLM